MRSYRIRRSDRELLRLGVYRSDAAEAVRRETAYETRTGMSLETGAGERGDE